VARWSVHIQAGAGPVTPTSSARPGRRACPPTTTASGGRLPTSAPWASPGTHNPQVSAAGPDATERRPSRRATPLAFHTPWRRALFLNLAGRPVFRGEESPDRLYRVPDHLLLGVTAPRPASRNASPVGQLGRPSPPTTSSGLVTPQVQPRQERCSTRTAGVEDLLKERAEPAVTRSR